MTAGARYVALDAWRGVAALMVALHHFPTNSSIYGLALVRNAYLFVDFFFVLSGFVIAANYQDRIARGFNIRRFMLLRIGRLYPLHFVMLLAFALTETLFALSGSVSDSGRDFFSGSTSPWALATNLLLIQSLGFNDGLTLNGVAWSISAEMWMYLLFAGLAFAVPARSRLGFTLLCAFAFAILVAHAIWPNTVSRFTDMARCILGFSLGVLIYAAIKAKGKPMKAVLGQPGAATLELLSVALACGFLWYAEAPANLLLAACAFTPLIFVFALEAGPLARFLNAKVFVTLGTLSYSIYMIHPFLQARILTPLALAAEKLMGITVFDHRPLDGAMTRIWGLTDWQGNLFTLAMLGTLIGAARFTYSFIEEPGRSFVRARVNKSGAAAELKGMTRSARA